MNGTFKGSRSFSLISDKSFNVVSYAFTPGTRKRVTVSLGRDGDRINRKITLFNLCDTFLTYQRFSSFVLSPKKLVDNAYPIDSPHNPNMVSVIENLQGFSKFWAEQVCTKCHQSYLAFNGHQLAKLPCRYHSGSKVYGEENYTCCGSSEECCTDSIHIPLVMPCQLLFEKTRHFGTHLFMVYSLDTEMCLTKCGLEVTKVTIIDIACQVVYDTYVLPQNPIIDYNTKYSGVTAENLKGVTTTLEDVQAVLLALFDAETILIGHGLENDLKALKIIHKMIIDTSIIFADPRGQSYKRSLKSLVTEFLGYDIQCSPDGHNSVEDAIACMRLVQVVDRNRNKMFYSGYRPPPPTIPFIPVCAPILYHPPLLFPGHLRFKY